MMGELYDAYQKYFEIVIADTPELKETVYQVRYKVLCQEQRIPGFDGDDYPNQLEKDDFDDRSIHALLKHKTSGKFIGTVRLVLADARSPEKPFPVESYADLNLEYLKEKKIPRLYTAEISRALVVKEFQRRKGDLLYQDTEEKKADGQSDSLNKPRERRVSANISLILMAAVVQMSVKHGAENWLSFINPSLNRLLGKSGMDFVPIGPLVECHGIRQPFFARMTDVLDRTYNEYQDVWQILTDHGKYLPAKLHA